MRDLLAENGSIYIHLDWHVGHYVKVMMDEIFGAENFKNEIVWRYGKMASSKNKFLSNHDIILFYSKTKDIIFNSQFINLERPIKRLARTVKDGRLINVKDEYGNLVYVEKWEKLIDDVWCDIPTVMFANPEFLDFGTQKPEILLKRIILTSSNPADIVADFFCGSGTTLAVAEKLDRRLIGCDLSKYAIQVTRKRLLDIHNSKNLRNESTKEYSNPARPFELWNIGNYETVYWQEREDEYLAFMLKLYQTAPLTGFRYLHGRKGDRATHIGPLNAPVTMEDVEKVVVECRGNNFNKADILGWEWSYEVNELAKTSAKKNGVDLKLVQIPSVNEIKSSLVGFDMQLLKVPEQIIEKELIKYIKFPEVAYLEIESKSNGKEIILKIVDFQLSPTAELAEIASKVKDSRELIDYWAIDWDYKEDTFHNQWQSFRLKKIPKVDYQAIHKYNDTGEYEIMVKVVDVFGNDTNKILKVSIK